MKFNPVIFTYKVYPNSKKATYVSRATSGLIHLLSWSAAIIFVWCIIDPPENFGEAMLTAIVMFAGGLYLRRNKEIWIQNILKKEEILHADRSGQAQTNTEQDNRYVQTTDPNIQKQQSQVGSGMSHISSETEIKKFCPYCGCHIEPSARFCPNCGCKL